MIANQDAAADPQEAQWVEARLIRLTMGSAGLALGAISLTIPVYIALLFGKVWLPGLLAWSAAALATCAWRWHDLRRYQQHFAEGQPQSAQLPRYWRRACWAWPVTAVVWSSALLLYYDMAEGKVAFVCAVVLVCMGAASVNLLSATRVAFNQFNSALGASVLVVLGYEAWGVESAPSRWQTLAVMFLILIFVALLRVLGQRLHLVQRGSVVLQYRNRQLIASLTQQSQAALDAVAIKNRFLASAAHDIRQPVHALSLYADWLHNEPELVAEIAPKILESTKAVNSLFDALFDLARLDSGTAAIDVQPVDVRRLMADLVVFYQPIAKNKGLEFRCRYGALGKRAVIMADPLMLQRLLGNLLSNAIKYTESGGLLLALRRRGGHLCMEVWDSGIGIAPEHHQQIFQEFYKVPTHSGTADSFGLGLAIVARLATILGYPVALQSVPGRGSVFRLQMSDVDAAQAQQRARLTLTQVAKNPWVRA